MINNYIMPTSSILSFGHGKNMCIYYCAGRQSQLMHKFTSTPWDQQLDLLKHPILE